MVHRASRITLIRKDKTGKGSVRKIGLRIKRDCGMRLSVEAGNSDLKKAMTVIGALLRIGL
jgi:hypothetical protein